MSTPLGRLGILGGTFDPIHLGHITSATEIGAAFCLDRVLLIVSARPPHKPNAATESAEHRLAMVRLAAADIPQLEACDLELKRPGPSYTVDTLATLSAEHHGADLYLIIGIDAYREIDTWHRSADLLELANVVVTTRSGIDFPPDAPSPPIAADQACCYDPAIGCYVHSSGHVVVAHPIRDIAASASDIRSRIRNGLPFEHLTGPTVARHIRDHGLYGVDRN